MTPLQTIAYLAAIILSPPALYVLVKVAMFFAKALTKLEMIDEIASDVRKMSQDKAKESHSMEMSLSIIEGDLNIIQEHISLPVRQYPDRRTGPADRRSA